MLNQKSDSKLFIFSGTAALCIVLLYFFVYPAYASYFPKCIFYTYTGFYCPGCGAQRAFVALLHAHFALALHNNLLFVTALLFMLYAAFIFCYNRFAAKKISSRLFYHPLFIRLSLAAIIAFGIVRNIPAFPFTSLAPL